MARKKLVLALENEEVVSDLTDDNSNTEVNEPVEVSDVVSSTTFDDFDEMDESIEDHRELTDDVISYAEEAYDDLQVLDSIQDTMESSIEEGNGLDKSAVDVSQIAVEAICVRLGVNTPAKEGYGLEAFKDTKITRINATRLAIEQIDEKKKGILDKIAAVFKMLMDKLKQFIKIFTENAQRLQDKLTELKKKLNEAGDFKEASVSTETSSAARIAYAISVDKNETDLNSGKINLQIDLAAYPNGAEILLYNAMEFIKLCHITVNQVDRAAFLHSGELSGNRGDQLSGTLEVLRRLALNVKESKFINGQVLTLSMKDGERSEYATSGKETLLVGVEIVQYKRLEDKDFGLVKRSKTLNLPDKKTCIELLDNAINLTDFLLNYKKDVDTLINTTSKLSKTSKSLTDEDSVREYGQRANWLQAVANAMAHLPTSIAYQTSKEIGNYVSFAMSNAVKNTAAVEE